MKRRPIYDVARFSGKDTAYLKILISVLSRNEVLPHYYAIGGYSEEAICLEKENGKYIIYLGERGQQVELDSFDRIFDACLCLIKHLPLDKGENYRVMAEFSCRVDKARDRNRFFGSVKKTAVKVAAL